MSTVCSTSDIISFPRQTNIKNIKTDYYDTLKSSTLNISFNFIPRSTTPQFSDSSRQTGELNESPGSSTCKYNNNDYELYNVQLCMATHRVWLKHKDSDNRIDIIITYVKKYEQSDIQPKFVILVLPLIIDENIQVNELYLSVLGGEMPNTILSLESLYNKNKDFYYYTTCLEPTGDKALAYISIDGIPLSLTLYYKILAQWKLQPLSSLMSEISNNVNGLKQKAQNLLGSIKNSNDVNDIQSKLDSASALTQTINLTTNLETWSYYYPYPGIVLNVTSKTFTLGSMDRIGFKNSEGFMNRIGFKNSEGFMNRIGFTQSEKRTINEGFQSDGITTVSSDGTDTEIGSPPPPPPPGSGPTLMSSSLPPPPAPRTVPASVSTTTTTTTSASTVSLNNVKCVPLDIDGVVDGSGNINFNSDKSIKLNDIQTQRNKVRSISTVENVAKKNKAFETAIAVFAGVGGGILLIIMILAAYSWYKSDVPAPPPNVFHPAASSIWYYLLIGIVLGFVGYLVGVATTPYIQ